MATAMAGERYWLTTAEVAALLGVTTRTVQRWARQGRIPVHPTVGGGINRFLFREVEPFIFTVGPR